MSRNYYVILGVASNASVEEVKSAFRRRARELHPDTSGLESGPFLEVQEAYGVLSDPERRRRYDASFRPSPVRRRPWGPSPEPLTKQRRAAEPLRPVETASSFQDIRLAESFAGFTPSFDELFDRWWSNFDAVSRPKAEKLESLTVEVVVGFDEARFGGRVLLQIPARATCPVCGGQGAVGRYACWQCEGQGALTADYPLEVEFPPALRDGYTVRIPLTRLGIDNFYLTVLFRVSGGVE